MLEAIEEFIGILGRAKTNYCIIGGIAVLLYGGRASTIDFDLYILTQEKERLLRLFEKHGILHSSTGEFQIKARFKDVPIDLLIADEWVGIPALKRARRRQFGRRQVRVASPEDLIVMKSISDRPIDRRDIEELREIFSGKLDNAYIRSRLASLKKMMN